MATLYVFSFVSQTQELRTPLYSTLNKECHRQELFNRFQLNDLDPNVRLNLNSIAEQCIRQVLLNRFHLNGQRLGFHPSTQTQNYV